jgi:uncharacterized protein (UPF0210 family)
MKIRSITSFLDPGWPLDLNAIAELGSVAARAKAGFQHAGYDVQTLRMATIPFPQLFSQMDDDGIVEAVQMLEQTAAKAGFAYLSIGPALLSHPDSYALIPKIIQNTENVFCSGQMAIKPQGLSLEGVRACAQIIADLAPQDPNGFANLYFTALANVEAGSPFFPASYHSGGSPAFSLATEAASLAVDAFEGTATVEEGLERLQHSVQSHADRLKAAASEIQAETGSRFGGIDFSLAPFPDQANSIGTAMERMGVGKVGLHGSLAAAAMLASALDQVSFPRVGFSGLFFPQLEDAVLAQRAADGELLVKDLLMYSAVCGTGLDTIPLPGDTTPQQLTPLLLDLAALALRLDKPLTARLMPVPGKQAGDETNFDFSFFANSRVMELSADPLNSPMAQSQSIPIFTRQRDE